MLEPSVEGAYMAMYKRKIHRFLLSDGSCVDVVAIRDDSDLRAAVLDLTKVERIEGVAHLPYVEPEPAPVKRVVRKKV